MNKLNSYSVVVLVLFSMRLVYVIVLEVMGNMTWIKCANVPFIHGFHISLYLCSSWEAPSERLSLYLRSSWEAPRERLLVRLIRPDPHGQMIRMLHSFHSHSLELSTVACLCGIFCVGHTGIHKMSVLTEKSSCTVNCDDSTFCIVFINACKHICMDLSHSVRSWAMTCSWV